MQHPSDEDDRPSRKPGEKWTVEKTYTVREEWRACAVCAFEFKPKLHSQDYCSSACRSTAFRRKKAGQS